MENSVRVVGNGLVRRLGLLDLVLISGSGDQKKDLNQKWIKTHEILGDGLFQRLGFLDLVLIGGGGGDRRKLGEERLMR